MASVKNSDRNTPEWRLLHPVSDNEETRRANIRDWLYSVGAPMVRVEYQTNEGPADIYLPNRRVMIEVKQKGHAQPYNQAYGSRPGETPLDQVGRYINAEKPNEIRGLDTSEDDMDLPWLGIVTDSQIWYIFELTDTGLKTLTEWKGRRLDSTNIHMLKKLLVDRKVGKEWAPEDPTDMFKESLEILTDTYEKKKDVRDVITQRELWYRQLKISGNQPDGGHKDELFVLHTLLIVISTKISEMYGSAEIRYGFASWAKDTDGFSYVDALIKERNWKQTTADTLRAIYMGLVDKKDRHIYGEYYTPDWLAEKLCMDVIDDEYIESWVRSGNDHNANKSLGGIMDPACGSGTFLYHAVRRIINSKPVIDATMTDRDLTDMIVQMIYGIDIHPVAVAMAKANILRALPDKPGAPLHVYQGDSLQITRNVDDDEQQRIDELESHIFKITSREGTEIRMPLEFIQSKNFDAKMHQFVKAAVHGRAFPARVDDDIKEESRREVLHKAFNVLTNVCRKEGNDIWAWYVINYAGVYLLKQSVSRIVANPPWVRMSSIQDEARKNETIQLAKKLDLWSGGKNATGFNIASLFVLQCQKIYGLEDMISGWVLPDAAMKGGNWIKYVEQTKAPVVYDLGDLAFPEHSKACVNMFGMSRQKPQRLVMNDGEGTPNPSESWDTLNQKSKFISIKQYKIKKSEWFEDKKPIAHQGATIVPHCLVILENTKKYENRIYGTTKHSVQGVWRGMTFEVNDGVPKIWMHDVLSNKNGLYPFVVGTPYNVILPIDNNGAFLKNRNNEKWWRHVSDIYSAHCGTGTTTPKTLEERLNFNNALSNQFPFNKHLVLYNKSGANLYAARQIKPMLCTDNLYLVRTRSMSESLFLVGILNADYLHDRFQQTRKSDRDFHTYFWHEIPIPRFNEKNPNHVKLVNYAKHAEQVASGIPDPTYNKIKQALRDDGVSQNIDSVVSEIIK